MNKFNNVIFCNIVIAFLCSNAYSANFISGKSENSNAEKTSANPRKIVQLENAYTRGIQFSPDGNILAATSGNHNINIWDWRNSKLLQTLHIEKDAGLDQATEKLLFSPDGNFLAVCHSRTTDGIVARIWNRHNWEIVKDIVDDVHFGGCASIAFSPDSRSLVRLVFRPIGQPGDNIISYSTSSWSVQWGITTTPFYVYSAAFRQDGKLLAVSGRVENPIGWNHPGVPPTFGSPPLLDTGLIIFFDIGKKEIVKNVPYNKVLDRVSNLAWSKNGKEIDITGGPTIHRVDFESGKEIFSLAPTQGALGTSWRYSSDRNFLAEAVTGPKINWTKVWTSDRKNLIFEIHEQVWCMSFSPDSRNIAVGTNDKIEVWNF
ncbi:hypothetical protein [Janthinobacterium sp.]|uniref:WD40 repeat domain-containing protein n=1 Tax=Janthinobacterium sp. TaxID=1871054 RepID=UPI00293D5F16|nr:hypothetical protein [Janthinobacterium sp.]